MFILYFIFAMGLVGIELAGWSSLRAQLVGDAVSLPTEVGLGAALGLSVAALSQWSSRRFSWAASLDNELRPLFQGRGRLYLSALAVVTGIVEELLFRGLLQPLLGLWWTTLLFGAAHPPQQRTHWPWTAAATVMGLIFGLLAELRGCLIAPIIAHFTINHFNLHALVFGDQFLGGNQ